jgi:hypothetical protein
MGWRMLGTLLIASGAAGLAVFGPGLVWAFRTGWNAGGAPAAVTVAEAPPRRWVRLTDATPRCETKRADRGMHVVLVTDGAGAHPFLTQLEDPERCESARREGLFLDERATAAKVKEAYGIEVPGGGEVRVLVPMMTRGFVALAGLPVLASVAVAGGGLWLGWRRKKTPPPGEQGGGAGKLVR